MAFSVALAPESRVALIGAGKRCDRVVTAGRRSLARGREGGPVLVGNQGLMPVDRLTDEDQRMLWPDEIWPQEIVALTVLDGSDLAGPDGRFRVEAVREVIAARLHLVPRFRQLLYTPRPGLGRPLWVDAPAFDLADHVRVLPPPAPGDEAALLRAAEQLRRLRLDRSRPLWQMWFLPGLAEGRVGMFVKIHHVIGDASAGLAALAVLLDAAPGTPAGPARPWTSAPPPGARGLLADNLRRHATGPPRGPDQPGPPRRPRPHPRPHPRRPGPGPADRSARPQRCGPALGVIVRRCRH
jgi:hypothetical protein